MDDIEVNKLIRKSIKESKFDEFVKLIDDDRSRLDRVTTFGTWLHMAAAHGQLEIAKWLVDQGVDIDGVAGISEGSPLNEAAFRGHIEVARFLLDSGAEMDTSDPVRNPLFSAIYGLHLDIATLLLDRGIEFRVKYNGKTMQNMDARAFARERGAMEFVKLLNDRSGVSAG